MILSDISNWTKSLYDYIEWLWLRNIVQWFKKVYGGINFNSFIAETRFQFLSYIFCQISLNSMYIGEFKVG